MDKNKKNSIENFDKPFAKALRDLLDGIDSPLDRKVSQKELADNIGISRQVISQYCNGDTSPNVERLKTIAEFFNVSSDFLIGLISIPSKNMEDKDIHEKTGLSDNSIKILSKNNYGKHGKGLFKYKDWEFPPVIKSLNMIIEEMNSPDSFLNLFTDYRNYKPDYEKKRFYTLHQDSGEITKTDNTDGMINIDPNLISFNADVIDNIFLMAIQDRLKEMKKNN